MNSSLLCYVIIHVQLNLIFLLEINFFFYSMSNLTGFHFILYYERFNFNNCIFLRTIIHNKSSVENETINNTHN